MKFIPLFAVFFILFTCNSMKFGITPSLTFETGPCKGLCPEYTVVIYKDTLIFKGLRNTLKLGEHKIKISKLEIKKIKSLIQKTDWVNINESYHNHIYDLPLKRIRFNSKNISFKTTIKDHKEINLLSDIIEQIVASCNLIK